MIVALPAAGEPLPPPTDPPAELDVAEPHQIGAP
jgi:hypothetical protein